MQPRFKRTGKRRTTILRRVAQRDAGAAPTPPADTAARMAQSPSAAAASTASLASLSFASLHRAAGLAPRSAPPRSGFATG